MTTVRYLTAEQWGMVWDGTPRPEFTPDSEVYVHHTVTGLLSLDGAEAFRKLNRSAINSGSYSAVAYDAMVHYNPYADVLTIGEGRGPWMSAATRRRNEEGEAVVVFGNFHPGYSNSRHPYPAELEGVALAIAWMHEKGWTTKDAWIGGHRDNRAYPDGQATACPGDNLYPHINPAISNRVAELLNPGGWNLRPNYSRRFDGSIGAGGARRISIGNTTHDEAMVRITVANPSSNGHVTIAGLPGSVHNFRRGETAGSLVYVPLDASGNIIVRMHHGSGRVIVDRQGLG